MSRRNQVFRSKPKNSSDKAERRQKNARSRIKLKEGRFLQLTKERQSEIKHLPLVLNILRGLSRAAKIRPRVRFDRNK